MTGNDETEVKIGLSQPAEIARVLQAKPFLQTLPRLFEANTLYDTEDSRLQKSGTLLRLRQVGEKGVITWKGPQVPGPHKSRPEIETTIGSIEQLDKILTNLGFRASFRYEKFRTEYKSAADADGVSLEKVTRYDATRSLAHVRFDGARGRLLRADADVLADAWYLAQALIAAESLGAVQTCLEMSVAYAKERFTFGRAIGSYQAIKHELTEVLRRLENDATDRVAAETLATL